MEKRRVTQKLLTLCLALMLACCAAHAAAATYTSKRDEMQPVFEQMVATVAIQ